MRLYLATAQQVFLYNSKQPNPDLPPDKRAFALEFRGHFPLFVAMNRTRQRHRFIILSADVLCWSPQIVAPNKIDRL